MDIKEKCRKFFRFFQSFVFVLIFLYQRRLDRRTEDLSNENTQPLKTFYYIIISRILLLESKYFMIYIFSVLRECIGWDHLVMVDANQKWSVPEAIKWMKELAKFKLHWIEEPTSPDDILGHLEISQALKEDGIGVATGEVCQNRVMFKQFLKSGAMQFCQIGKVNLYSFSLDP